MACGRAAIAPGIAVSTIGTSAATGRFPWEELGAFDEQW